MTPKESALAIATALAAVEEEADSGDGVGPALADLHTKLRAGLYEHGELLGLTAEDIAEIDNLGPQQRGGGPKNPVVQE